MAIYLGTRGAEPPGDEATAAADGGEAGRRRRDPEATRQALLDAAAELFTSHGPSATSLSQVAKRAGVTKSLIHHHFGSKDELFAEVQQRYFEEYFAIQYAMLEGEASDSLSEDSLVAYFRFLQKHPESVRFHAWALAAGDSDGEAYAHKGEKALYELGIRRIREAQERGEIRDDLEPFFIIRSLLALPMAWFQNRSETLAIIDSEIEPEEIDEMYLRDMVSIFLRGIQPR